MFEYGPRPHLLLSEIEVFIGDILGKTGALTTRQRELCVSMKERFADILSFMVEWIRGEEYDHEDEESKANRAVPEHVLELSIACFALPAKQFAGVQGCRPPQALGSWDFDVSTSKRIQNIGI